MRSWPVLTIVLFLTATLGAQPRQFSFFHYTTEQGLSHDDINCLLRDKDGFLWIGTIAGLNRFDGRSFKVFRPVPGNDHSLPGERITGLEEDEQGRIWVSTDRGLCWYDRGDGLFHRVDPRELPDADQVIKQLSELELDRNGSGWFIAGRYLVRLNLSNLKSKHYPLPANAGGNGIVHIDRRGYCWVSVSGTIYRFFPETGQFRPSLGLEAPDTARQTIAGQFYEEPDGTLWCSTWGKGLFQYKPKKDMFVDFPDGYRISTCVLRQYQPDGQTFFWLGGGIYGLYIFSLTEDRTYEFPPNPYEPLSHNGAPAKDLLLDEDTGILWIGTEFGLEQYDPNGLRFQRGLFPQEADINQFNFVSSFVQDRTDPRGHTYWIGVWGTGLYKWDRRNDIYRRLKEGKGILNNEVFDVVQSRNGELLIGMMEGVQVLDPRTEKTRMITGFLKAPKLSHKVLSVLEDHAGNIWMGSNHEGLFRHDPRTGKTSPVSFCDSLTLAGGAKYVSQLVEDSSHRIWLSTFNGVYCHDPATGKTISIKPGHPAICVSDDICLGLNGTVWAATRSGLLHIDSTGRLLKDYRGSKELPSDEVYRVRLDRSGRLWVGTVKGLYRLGGPGQEPDRYDKSDGLFRNSISDGFELLPNGEIFIGFQKAFNFFDPQDLSRNRRPPNVVLTGLRVMEKERRLEEGEELVLGPNENVVTFEFAALNFSQPDKNRYAYQLVGFNKDWIYTDKPMATYTNLDGGEYTFRVKAANNDGVWNDKGLTVTFRVIPPFYRAGYFPFLVMLVIAGVAGAVGHYRRLQRLQLEDIRDRIARDLHDDMGSTLSSIRFFSEYARAQVEGVRPEVVPVLQRISSSAAALSESMQDIIWTINSRNDKLDDLVTRMREFGFRTLEARQIAFTAQISKGFRPMRLTIGQRRNLYLIFKEAVNNASKYSNCTRVTLFLTIVRNNLKMIVEDDGQGFDAGAARGGNGLRNMRQRAGELGGKLELFSAPGKGTRIELVARLK